MPPLWTMDLREFPYRNILLIKPGAVGDLLQLTPVLRALKKNSPSPRITLIVGTPSTATLFRNDPNVDEVIVFDRSRTPFLPLWNELRGKRFDLVLNFQRSNLRAWFLASAAFPCRVLVYHKARARTVHAAENYIETLAPLGIPSTDIGLTLSLDEESRSFARELFRSHGLGNLPVVALNPGATHAVNRWPASLFAVLADRIQSELSAAAVVIGGPDDLALAGEIVERSRSKPLSLAGTTSLLQLGAVLEQCAALVSGDTGPMHMATAVGTPVIALFGAADPARTGPVGSGHRVIRADAVGCVPCRSRACSNRTRLECMEKIDVELVLRAVEASLRKQR
jgi:ADP-heptose:LPS heptosyltransferase